MFWTADRIYSQGIEQAQQRIYEFFLELVRRKHPDEVLSDFYKIFIGFSEKVDDPHSLETLQALEQILTAYNEKEFFYTLRRCCYIIINNWTVSGNRNYVQSLIDLFSHPIVNEQTSSIKEKTLRAWLQVFVKSEDFVHLKLFAVPSEVNTPAPQSSSQHWGDRFASYLLTYQALNPNSSIEQRQVANILAQKTKDQFKFDLAMYTARINQNILHPNERSGNRTTNPTSLSNNVLNLVTLMLTKRSVLNCKGMANNFLASIPNISYQEFKDRLLHYLDFSIADPEIANTVNTHFAEGLANFKQERNFHVITSSLIIKTAKYLVCELTIGDRGHPTELFNILLHHTNPLNLVVILLKLLLLEEAIHSHVEIKIARLIKYYGQYSESKCKSVIAFIDMFNIALVVYAGETRYNIVRMNPNKDVASDKSRHDLHNNSHIVDLDTQEYRIFSQA